MLPECVHLVCTPCHACCSRADIFKEIDILLSLEHPNIVLMKGEGGRCPARAAPGAARQQARGGARGTEHRSKPLLCAPVLGGWETHSCVTQALCSATCCGRGPAPAASRLCALGLGPPFLAPRRCP